MSNILSYLNKNGDILDLNKPILFSMENVSVNTAQEMRSTVDDDGCYTPTLIDFSKVTRNRTKYPMEDIVKALKTSPIIKERIANRIWAGEDGHPDPELGIGRLLKIDDDNVSHIILKWFIDSNKLKGKIKWAEPKGSKFKQRVEEIGSNIAFSLRAHTPNYVIDKSSGEDVVIKKFPMTFVTFDAVQLPGYETARLVDPNDYAANNKYWNNGSMEKLHIKEHIFENPANEIIDIIRSEESFDVLSYLYQVDFSKSHLTLNGDNTVNIRSTEGISLNVHMDNAKLSRILGS